MIKDYLVNVRTTDDKLPLATRITLDGVEVWKLGSPDTLPPPPPMNVVSPSTGEVSSSTEEVSPFDTIPLPTDSSDNFRLEEHFPDADKSDEIRMHTNAARSSGTKLPSKIESIFGKGTGGGKKRRRTIRRKKRKASSIKTKSKR
jgi:hypothetical protein